MSVKERLHQLVEAMPDGDAESLLHLAEARAAQPRQRVSALGKYAHVGASSEDFMRRKQEEIALEEEQAERRMRGEG